MLEKSTNDRGGALNALANYWITKMRLEDADSDATPEENLQGEGASQNLSYYLHDRYPGHQWDGFVLSLANTVSRNPLDAGRDVRAVIHNMIADHLDMEDLERALDQP